MKHTFYVAPVRLRELFDYDNGNLTWKEDKKQIKLKGKIAGGIDNSPRGGYRRIKVDGDLMYAHRLVWIYHNGDIPDGLQIDHINCVRTDNRIENLRLVTSLQNRWNLKKTKGYMFEKSSNSYRVRIQVNGKEKHIGRYKTTTEARNAYLKAKDRYHNMECVA